MNEEHNPNMENKMEQIHDATPAAVPTDDYFGFYGYMNRIAKLDATQAWQTAFEVLRASRWKPTDIIIRTFLRSYAGYELGSVSNRYVGTLAERIRQVLEEEWVAQEFDHIGL